MRHASVNHIYRLVWSQVYQSWIAVSERARGRGKTARPKLFGAALLTVAHAALGAPTGGAITAGSGSISQSGNTTTVNQSSANLAVNWQTFNTTSQETVNFVQPSASAIAVNRIADTNPTQFLGHLNANGQIYLINPNGIVFGAGAQINVGGLVASTLDISDTGLSGAARNFTGAGTGSIINQGTITATNGGYVAFIGKTVSNQGNIVAPGGAVGLAAGNDVTLSFAGNSMVAVQVNQSTLDSLAENGGLIQSDGGAVWLSAGAKDAVLASVVNNTGVIQARSVQNVNGTIVLDAGGAGTATNSGKLDASGANSGETGGTVDVLGNTVNATGTSSIDVSGDAGGGTALIGGNFHGAGPEHNATTTTVDAGATINADAMTTGNGGNVAVWSGKTTTFDGSISARGGATAGDGGQVETSGETLHVGTTAAVSTSAAHGSTGNWLLDPADIIIGNMSFWSTQTGAPTIDVDSVALTNALNSSSITIKTNKSSVSCTGTTCGSGSGSNGDIILLDAIGTETDSNGQYVNWNTGNATLTLSAYRNIQFKYDSVASQAGFIDISGNAQGKLVLQADNAATGTGTIIFDQVNANGIGLDNTPVSGAVKIYYTSANYSAIDFTPYLFSSNSVDLSPYVTGYMSVNVGATVASKTYDGTTSATVSVSAPSSLPSGVQVNKDSATGTFASANAGTGIAVALSNVTFSNNDTTITVNGDSYYLNGLTSQTGTITQKALSISGLTANGKTYDGTTTATLSGTAGIVSGGIVGSDNVALSGTGSGTFSSANAGLQTVTVGGYSLSGTAASNYTLSNTSLSATIAKATLSLSGTKTYDGTTSVNGSVLTAQGVNGETFTVTGSGDASNLASKNVQSNASLSTLTGLSLGTGSSGASSSNYNALSTTNSAITVTPKSLTVTGITAADKVYDTTTQVVLDASGVTLSGLVAGDSLTLAGASGAFADKNVGTNKQVTVSSYTTSGTDAANYTLVMPSNITASISKANLTVSGVGAQDKTYDGTTSATLTGTAAVSALGSDVVTLSGTGSGTFASKNVGTNAVTLSGYSLSGTDAGNYNLVSPVNLSATIDKANLALSGISASNKTYDGTTAATLTGSATVTAFGSDVVSLTGTGTGTFATKDVGVNKAVTVTGYTLNGADAGNYTLIVPSNLTAQVTKAALNITGLTVSDKTYDGGTSASLIGTATVSAIGADQVSVSGTGTATFGTKDAGINKNVTVTGYSLSGQDANNYEVVQPASLTATIDKANLLVSGISAANKTYDGTTSATLNGTAVVTALQGDTVSVTGTGLGTFVDKNAGTSKSVTVTGYTLGGSDANNYNLVEPTNVTAAIAKADLTLAGVSASNKTYDGTTSATLTGTASVTALQGDTVGVSGTGVGAFADKNVGASKSVTLSGYTLSGTDAGNYNLIEPSNVTASISKADLSISGISAASKTYDGTTAATLTGSAAVSALQSDTVSLTGSGTAVFADKNVGTNKQVTVSGYTLSGVDAGNYTLVVPSNITASINKADLSISGLSASSKTYDGTTTATVTGIASISAIGSDVVSLNGTGTGAFADKNVAVNKAVSVTGYTLSGTDAGNYQLVAPASLVASITPATLTVSGITANNKMYDGSSSATTNISGATLAGLIGSDQVTLISAGSFLDANVGNGKMVNLVNTMAGTDARNYVLTGDTTTLANITPLPTTTPPAVTASIASPQTQQAQSAVTQVQSTMQPPQAATQPQSLTLSSTIVVQQTNTSAQGNTDDASSSNGGATTSSRFINTNSGFGSPAPTLQIQNGGMRLPPLASSVAE
jgi:filamentous hemagglutinin family protein